MRNWHKFGAKLTKNLVRNRSQFWCEIDLNLVRNRSFYQTGFGAKLTSLLYWIWCEIYLFTLLNLVRIRPKFGAKIYLFTFMDLVWNQSKFGAKSTYNLVRNWPNSFEEKMGFGLGKEHSSSCFVHGCRRNLENQAEGYGGVASALETGWPTGGSGRTLGWSRSRFTYQSNLYIF